MSPLQQMYDMTKSAPYEINLSGNPPVKKRNKHRVRAVVGLALLSVIALAQTYRGPASPLYANPLSLRSSQQACPKPSSRDRFSFRHTRRLTTCQTVPTNLTQFSSEICHDPRRCNAFTVRFKRIDAASCQSVESAALSISNDPSFEQFVRRERGPDSFLIRTDGAERWASEWSFYEGDCTYSFDVQLSNGGQAYLEAWWSYQNYEPMLETEPRFWPEQLHLPMFAQPILLDICSAHCLASTVPLLPSSIPPFKIGAAHDLAALQIGTKPCSPNQPVSGTYYPVQQIDILHPSVDVPSPMNRPAFGQYRFVPSGCSWQHSGLRTAGNTFASCRAQPKRVLITGDSHGRLVYHGMVHRMSGNAGFLMENSKTEVIKNKLGDLQMDFVWDPKGEDLLANGLNLTEIPDVVMISMTHWLAIDLPTSDYLVALQAQLEAVERSVNSKTIKIFMTPPAHAPRQDEHPKNFRERRTTLRLQTWRNFAIPLVLSKGWRVLDQFERTMPVVLEPLLNDQEHFTFTDALEPMADEAIAKSNLCT